MTLLVCLMVGCDLPGKPKPADQYMPPQKEMTFSVLFQENCIGCHGADGKLGPAPPLNDRLFLALAPDTELQRVISEGRTGTLMPAFAASQGGHLTDAQIKALALGVAAYAFSPIDLIPDFIPVLGLLDDLIIVPLGIALVVGMIPDAVMAEHRAAALQAARPVSRAGAAAVIAIWIMAAAAAAWWAWRLVAPLPA